MLEIEINRRSLLKMAGLGTLVWITGCKSFPNAPEVIDMRREAGIWSQSEVEALARAMMDETQLNDVAFAGSVLLDNQRGKPSFSKMSPVFTDDKVKVTTVEDIDSSGAGLVVSSPMKARIKEDRQRVIFDLRSRTTGDTTRISAPLGLNLEEIQLNARFTKEYSDFLTRFLLTKEVLNITAFDMVSAYLTTNTVYNKYEVPQDARLRNAVQAAAIQGSFKDVPAYAMADLWAHFLLVPNYLLALDQNRFTQQEAESNVMLIFKYAAEVFQDSGVLNKNKNAGYEWTKDSDKFFTVWIDFATAEYNTLKKKKVS